MSLLITIQYIVASSLFSWKCPHIIIIYFCSWYLFVNFCKLLIVLKYMLSLPYVLHSLFGCIKSLIQRLMQACVIGILQIKIYRLKISFPPLQTIFIHILCENGISYLIFTICFPSILFIFVVCSSYIMLYKFIKVVFFRILFTS